jgi:TolB-like protein/Tfp pilus assembly protein PilF
MSEANKAVFLSYASQDAEAAKRICEALRAGGIEVWFDQSELRGGDSWDRKIRQQIHDCALFIPIISATTQGRVEGYFRREWKLAVDRTHDMSERVAFLVPVVIDGTSDAHADVPDAFRAVQWSRLPQGETPSAFVNRIAELLTPGALPGVSVPRKIAATPSPSRSRIVLLIIAAVAILAAGYFAMGRLVPSKSAADKSIAVLPFADMSENKDQEYFSDGLAEEVLDLLAKTPGLHVIARTSSFSFKGKSDDIPTIARKLGVANLLEGGVRKSGNRLRVTTQLIRAGDGEQLWSETYDRELKDVFAVQDEIAEAVVKQLKLKLAPAQESAAHRTSNVEAYNEYLLGRQFGNRQTIDGYRRAIDAYHQAIALDPRYTAAYADLVAAEFFLADQTGDAAGLQRAQAAADKAVELGPEDAAGYAARGFIRNNIAWDWVGAQADLEKALALDPSDARVLSRYASLLATLGRLPEAIAAAKGAVQLDPLSSSAWLTLAEGEFSSRDFTAANAAVRHALQISPESDYAINDLADLQLLEGNTGAALVTFRKVALEGLRLCGIAMAAYTLKDPKESQRALDDLIAKYAAVGAFQIADVYAWRGETDKAYEWLDRAYAQRDDGLTQLKYDRLLDSIRADPRYAALLRKMKLP